MASRGEVAGIWSQAGGNCQMDPGGLWYAVLPKEEWPEDPRDRKMIEDAWVEGVGDRRQELVIIGVQIDREAIRSGLDACLLTKEEMKSGDAVWLRYEDPFPAWNMAGLN
jgi:G3E family GTPase